MMGLYSQYETSAKLEKEGRWLNYGQNEADGKDIRIRVARSGGGNKAFRKLMEAKTRPHRRAIETGKIDPDTLNAIMIEVMAQVVVVDWENVTDRDGKKLTCTKENIIKLLTDLPDLYAEILAYSQDGSVYRLEEMEEESKN